MRTVYLGHNPGYAAVCHEESELLAVFWHEGSGNLAVRTGQMLEYCRKYGIVTVRHNRLDDVIDRMIGALSPDLIVVGEYHNLLKKNIINIPRYGAINMHGAPLPRYRGAHPINWMIINGETEGAVTCHYVSDGLDSGDIIGQYFFDISEAETAYDVRPKIEETGCKLLRDVLRRFSCEGRLTGTPQDEAQALYTPPRKPEDGLIDWYQSPKRIYDFVRALTRPYPGAFAMYKGHKVHIWKVAQPESSMVFDESSSRPGTVLSVDQGAIVVAVTGGRITVLDWESETVIRGNDCFEAVMPHSGS
ncbi:MAG: methionyl-tRNA formyltransferase [Geobacteraceae bacterium]|nr:methionyl-tRNA formyltransferase [Geobacteraceae bacterium]